MQTKTFLAIYCFANVSLKPLIFRPRVQIVTYASEYSKVFKYQLGSELSFHVYELLSVCRQYFIYVLCESSAFSG